MIGIGLAIGMNRRDVFNPKQVSGLVLWVNAANVIKDGSNNVSQMTDLSGGGKHLTQATLLNQPLFVPAALNNRAVIRTDGVNDSLVSPAMGFSGDQAVTMFVVFKHTSGGAVCGFLSTQAGGIYQEKWNHLVATASSSAGVATAYHVRTISKTPGVFQPNAVQRVNGSAVTNTYSGTQVSTYVPNFLSSTTFLIGIWAGQYGVNDFAEIVIYNRVLNGSELAKVEGYLKRRYAL
jgi:hypothetical protein